jgi:hypothetical protein
MRSSRFRLTPTLAALLMVGVALPAYAQDFKVSSSIWKADDRVTITGDDLYGTYLRLRKLCFASVVATDSLTCFGRYDVENKVWVNDDDPYLLRWDQNRLEFKVPPSMPPRGNLYLMLFNDQLKCFGSAGCVNSPTEVKIDLGQFTTVPRIDRLLIDQLGTVATSIGAGQTYRIEGTLFGKDEGSISLGKSVVAGNSAYVRWTPLDMTDIVSWSDREILFTPSKPVDASGGIQVSNGINVSNIFQVTTGTASTSSSSRQSASSASSLDSAAFTDVPANHPYAAAIEWAKSRGILQGYPDGTFRPDNSVNRAEFLKIVLTAKEVVTANDDAPLGFSDVDNRAWYARFIRFAKQTGIIQGYPDGTFRPEQSVNFAEALKMAYVALGIETADGGPEWYSSYLSHARNNDILFSSDVDLATTMSRKDVVWIIWKLLDVN